MSKTMAAQVLFGMVVRERRRIAALAKVASSIDERVQATEKALVVSEAALRACLEDHRHDVANLEQRQHDQMICLIDMVTENADRKYIESENDLQSVAMFQKKLLVLANERVSLYVHLRIALLTCFLRRFILFQSHNLFLLVGQTGRSDVRETL
jgi:hypothetical protein